MASLLSTGVTVLQEVILGTGIQTVPGDETKVGKLCFKLLNISGTCGGATDQIVGSAMGFSKILMCSGLTSNSTVYPTSINTTGAYILLAEAGSVTAANHVSATNLNMGTNNGTIAIMGIYATPT